MTSDVPASSRVFAIEELLAKILGHTISTHEFNDWQPGEESVEFLFRGAHVVMSKDAPPWPFLLVGKHWRHVVLSTPALWSTIIFCFQHFEAVDEALQLSLLDAHLKRSRNQPLTIIISLHDYGARAFRFFCALQEKLWPAQHRWQDVKLRIKLSVPYDPNNGNPTIPMDLRTLRLRNMKTLQSLYIHCETLSSRKSLDIVIELGPNHCLQRLGFEGTRGMTVYTPDDAPAEDLFPKLRSLSLCDEEGSDWHSLLQHASSIKHLEIKNNLMPLESSSVHWHYYDSMRPINLPNLRTLHIEHPNVERLLRLMKLPSSTELKISYDSRILGGHEDFLTLKDTAVTIENSGVELTGLSLCYCEELSYPINDVFQELLSVCAGLRSISFQSPFSRPFGKIEIPALTTALNLDFPPAHSGPLSRLDTCCLQLGPTFAPVEEERVYLLSIRDFILAFQRRYSESSFRFVLKFDLQGLRTSENYLRNIEGQWKALIQDVFYANTELQSHMNESFVLSVYLDNVELNATSLLS